MPDEEFCTDLWPSSKRTILTWSKTTTMSLGLSLSLRMVTPINASRKPTANVLAAIKSSAQKSIDASAATPEVEDQDMDDDAQELHGESVLHLYSLCRI